MSHNNSSSHSSNNNSNLEIIRCTNSNRTSTIMKKISIWLMKVNKINTILNSSKPNSIVMLKNLTLILKKNIYKRVMELEHLKIK
jgi:hypothetical protein